MKVEKSCGCIIIVNDKVLLIRQNSGNYGFPKGHMDGNETEIETAIRETKEETGIDAIIDASKRYALSYKKSDDAIKEVVYFRATTSSMEYSRQESEVSEIIWADIDEVEEILTFNDLKEIWFQLKKEL